MQFRLICDTVPSSTSYQRTIVSLLLLMSALAVAGGAAGRSSDLERDFRNPPESARPWVYWFIMDGNLTREGVTADFEALKRAGMGGGGSGERGAIGGR